MNALKTKKQTVLHQKKNYKKTILGGDEKNIKLNNKFPKNQEGIKTIMNDLKHTKKKE